MDRFLEIMKDFIEVVGNSSAQRSQVPHKVAKPFLLKLLDMANIFKDECTSEEESLLLDVLSSLLNKQEPKMRGPDG